MGEWWLVRDLEQVSSLTPAEWTQLRAMGHRRELRAGQRLGWGIPYGVLLVSQGTIRLSVADGGARPWLDLHAGDGMGTLAARGFHLSTHHTTLFYTFSHAEWLCALSVAPRLTLKLLRGMACHAMQAECQPATRAVAREAWEL